ncbi:hypothetical protein H0H81_001059, partial [Sphagnurus paluster]
RRCRQCMHKQFHSTAAPQFRPHELKAAHGLLRRLLDDSDDIIAQLRHMSADIIFLVAYGLSIRDRDDPYVETAERAVIPLNAAIVPGAFLVDVFPFLKYIPEWMPFAGFKRKARKWRQLTLDMITIPLLAAKRKVEDGDYIPSFLSYSLASMDETGDVEDQEDIIKSTAGALYAAGLDTAVSAIAICILALLSNPEALRKGQREIDNVITPGQLPTFEDKDSLPYITAIAKEAMRWHNVTPLALPHLLEVEDEYKGYRIPARSIVMSNVWYDHMTIIYSVYPDPFTFNPDRFMKDGKLNPDIKDPSSATFGFGRRICPGREMALDSIWITVALMVATLDISKPVDDNGEVVEPSGEFSSSVV